MMQFLETIKILDGIPQHLVWHQRRVDATLRHFYPAHHHTWELISCIDIPDEFSNGIVRCRIEYDAHHFDSHFFHYQPRLIGSLKMIELPESADYGYKYADRRFIEDLFEKRGTADDILMTRKGWITDTSIANIAFLQNSTWYSPSIPLLAGTTWKRLVSSGEIIPRPIHLREISLFDCYKVFNALNDFGIAEKSSVENINYHG